MYAKDRKGQKGRMRGGTSNALSYIIILLLMYLFFLRIIYFIEMQNIL